MEFKANKWNVLLHLFAHFAHFPYHCIIIMIIVICIDIFCLQNSDFRMKNGLSLCSTDTNINTTLIPWFIWHYFRSFRLISGYPFWTLDVVFIYFDPCLDMFDAQCPMIKFIRFNFFEYPFGSCNFGGASRESIINFHYEPESGPTLHPIFRSLDKHISLFVLKRSKWFTS